MINGANYIIKKLNKKGYLAYMVGGCVRDRIIGITPNDYDITTNALPDEIISIFEKTFLTGKKHGTVTVLHNGYTYEVTTFRIDGKYKDYRRPENITFTNELKEDIKRRDFTINSIAFSETDGYIDYFNGIDDIKNKVIRTVLNPYDRFKEDALRILRAVRFSVKFGYSIEEETFNAMLKLCPLIKNISSERITDELSRMFLYDPYKAVTILNEINFFPIIDIIITNKKLEMLKKLKRKNFINTLTILIYDLPEYDKILNKLKLSNEAKSVIKKFICGLSCNFEDKASLKRFLSICDITDSFYDFNEILKIITCKSVESYYKEIVKNKECYLIKDLAIDGNDLKKLGIKDKMIGKTLNILLEKVITDNSLNQYEILVNEIKNGK